MKKTILASSLVAIAFATSNMSRAQEQTQTIELQTKESVWAIVMSATVEQYDQYIKDAAAIIPYDRAEGCLHLPTLSKQANCRIAFTRSSSYLGPTAEDTKIIQGLADTLNNSSLGKALRFIPDSNGVAQPGIRFCGGALRMKVSRALGGEVRLSWEQQYPDVDQLYRNLAKCL